MIMRSLKAIAILAIIVVLPLAISGCTSPTTSPAPTAAPTATPEPTPVASSTVLEITGLVYTPLNLMLGDLNGYEPHYAAWQNQTGNSTFNGTGPYVLDLLKAAGLKSEATNVTFTCTKPESEMSTTVTLADLNTKYSDSIIAYNWTGVNKQGEVIKNINNTLQLIVPAGDGKNQVGDISLITIS
jgi:hypothetical protein